MHDPPRGTVTFLFTDLEGSTRLWLQHPATMGASLAQHDTLLHQAIEAHEGHIFKKGGDGFYAAFSLASQAVAAAVAAQSALLTEPWQPPGPLRVRIALHTGAV